MLPIVAAAQVEVRTKFDGKLVRAAVFLGWTPDSKGICVSTGFGNVDSLHRIDQPGGVKTAMYTNRL